MTLDDQLHSFTGTLTYEGAPVLINYNRLLKLIFNKDTPSEQIEDYKKQLGRIPEHITTAPDNEPELLYFRRTGNRYHIYTLGLGNYKGHKLSMEGDHRTWSAYDGTNSTDYVITLFGRGRNNITVQDLSSNQLDIILLAAGRKSINNYGIPGAPPAFTDRNDDDFERGEFTLTIIDRNVAP